MMKTAWQAHCVTFSIRKVDYPGCIVENLVNNKVPVVQHPLWVAFVHPGEPGREFDHVPDHASWRIFPHYRNEGREATARTANTDSFDDLGPFPREDAHPYPIQVGESTDQENAALRELYTAKNILLQINQFM
jgi:hypothetical protein